MNKKLLLAAALATTAGASIAVAAQQTAPAPTQLQPRPAPDQNRVVTRDAFLASADTRFQKLDANGDNSLSPEEMATRPTGRRHRSDADAKGGDRPQMKRGGRGAAAMFARTDRDGDGAISREEYRAAAMVRFERMDANKDGQIDAAERQALREQMRERREAMRAKRDTPVPAPAK